MSLGRRRRTPSLTLVASGPTRAADGGAAGNERNAPGVGAWSGLMARAQDGDRQAYRALLEDVTPYLRALAARRFKAPGDIEDAVQDV